MRNNSMHLVDNVTQISFFFALRSHQKIRWNLTRYKGHTCWGGWAVGFPAARWDTFGAGHTGILSRENWFQLGTKQPAAYRESSEKWVKDMMACQRHVVCQAASIPGNLLLARLHVTFGLCDSYVSGVLHKVIRTYVSMSSILCISFRCWLGCWWWWRMAMIQKRLQCQLVSFPVQFPDGHRTIIHRLVRNDTMTLNGSCDDGGQCKQ